MTALGAHDPSGRSDAAEAHVPHCEAAGSQNAV